MNDLKVKRVYNLVDYWPQWFQWESPEEGFYVGMLREWPAGYLFDFSIILMWRGKGFWKECAVDLKGKNVAGDMEILWDEAWKLYQKDLRMAERAL